MKGVFRQTILYEQFFIHMIVIITAGSDRKIRLWNNKYIENSYVIIGSDIDEAKPIYR